MLIGHEKIIDDLKRLAGNKELPHGYIFFGPAMVGKRTVARSLANFLENGVFELPSETEVLQDSITIAPDEKGTLGIDAVRELKNFLWQKPNVSTRRMAIIDGGELLTPEAQNALLKVTEEPPQSALLILVTSDIDGLLPTISSRLQKIYFGTVSSMEMEKWLMERGISKKSAKDAVEKSSGKPGLAAAFLGDKEFQDILKSAENLLKLSSERRRDLVKKLMEDDNFDFAKLLDAMILCIAADGLKESRQRERWHKFLALRHDVAYFNLNPKLQLEALLS